MGACLYLSEHIKNLFADHHAAIYNRYYKRYSARVKSWQIKEADFKAWKYQALTKRDECSDGIITPEEYIEWMGSCFPNRYYRTDQQKLLAHK